MISNNENRWDIPILVWHLTTLHLLILLSTRSLLPIIDITTTLRTSLTDMCTPLRAIPHHSSTMHIRIIICRYHLPQAVRPKIPCQSSHHTRRRLLCRVSKNPNLNQHQLSKKRLGSLHRRQKRSLSQQPRENGYERHLQNLVDLVQPAS